MYCPALIILPEHISHQDDFNQYLYIANTLSKYAESYESESYIVISADKLKSDFHDNEDDYASISEFCKKWYGCTMDEFGNGVSKFNKDSLFVNWKIGGKYNKQIKTDIPFCEMDENLEDPNYSPIHTIEDNSVTIEDFITKINQWRHHIVDHNGVLHKHLKQIPDSQWENMMLSILADCKNGLVVLIECET